MKSVAFYTLGCKVNQYETEAMSELFIKNGYTLCDFDSYADIYIINTCTVTAESDRKSRQIIRRAKKFNPNAYVIVTGCYAQVSKEAVEKIEGVNLVIGTKDRDKIVELSERYINEKQSESHDNIMYCHSFEQLKITDFHSRTRAYIKVQEGCNQFCSYCIIPYARGPIRSRDFDEVIEETKRLADAGFTEVTFVGIHIASYGVDNKGYSLSDLLIAANKVEGIKRIRLSSIEPMTLNREFVDSIKDVTKLCHHFHLSLQSGCDETLARMNRRYTTDQYYEIIAGLREHFPDVSVTTDIMVGFPGETEEEFSKTLAFAEKVQFSGVHIFPYSRRQGTPADTFKNQLTASVKSERSKRLKAVCDRTKDDFLSRFKGKTLEVLFEQKSGEYFEGKTGNYISVYVKTDEALSGAYKNVVLDTPYADGFMGRIIEEN